MRIDPLLLRTATDATHGSQRERASPLHHQLLAPPSPSFCTVRRAACRPSAVSASADKIPYWLQASKSPSNNVAKDWGTPEIPGLRSPSFLVDLEAVADHSSSDSLEDSQVGVEGGKSFPALIYAPWLLL